MATEIAELVEKKSKAYGDSFGKSGEILKLLYPDGIKPDQYTNALAIVRIIDKLFRIATDKDAFGESPWRDIVGYGLNAASREEQPTPKPEPFVKLKAKSKFVEGPNHWVGAWDNIQFTTTEEARAYLFMPDEVKKFTTRFGMYYDVVVYPQSGY